MNKDGTLEKRWLKIGKSMKKGIKFMSVTSLKLEDIWDGIWCNLFIKEEHVYTHQLTDFLHIAHFNIGDASPPSENTHGLQIGKNIRDPTIVVGYICNGDGNESGEAVRFGDGCITIYCIEN